MASRRVFAGSTLSSLEDQAFETLAPTVGTQPESVLYIGQQEHPRSATTERWQAHGPPGCLRVDTFDDIVADCYERDQFKGRVTHIDRPLLFRLVEHGVERLESPANPFHPGGEFPRAGLVDAAEDLYTNLEFAGLLSPEAMRTRLVEEGLTRRAPHVEALAEAIETVRQDILADELPDTYRTERMQHVSSMDTRLREVLPSVDAVVLGGFTRFNPLERELLTRIVDTWPTVALFPTRTETDGVPGIDAGAASAFEVYRDLDFSIEYHERESSPGIDSRRRIAASLYRHPDDAPSTADVDPNTLDLTYSEPETVPEEIRQVARAIRDQLGDGVQAEDIGVVLTAPSEYAEQTRETFETYEIPYALQAEVPLSETALGEVVEAICDLTREPRSVDTLLTLFTNPLVSVSNGGDAIDYSELARVASRVETARLATVLEHVDETLAATIDSILNDATALTEVELDALPGRLDALLQRLGVVDALETDDAFSSGFVAREESARARLDRVLETLVVSAPAADPELGDSVDRLARALSTVSVRRANSSEEQRVVGCGLGEAFLRDFDHIYVLGLTASHFPSDPDDLSFVQPIYDAHPDFEQGDAGAEARYQFGTLLASDGTLHLSTPQRSLTGDPYVEADVVTELRRLVDLSETPAKRAAQPGSQEDVQRSLGDRWADLEDARAASLLDDATEAGTFEATQRHRIERGAECAAARADPMLTPYDGKLSPETVATIHAVSDREPYSPSRLETYAACGFKYYMRRVLGIKAPDPLTREPDPGTRGSFIHAVLEHYYLSLQTTDGEPVSPAGDFDDRQEQLLAVARTQLDDEFGEYPETAFQNQWLTSVLAGLGTPDTNKYYGPAEETADGKPVARGLFYRFLEHEFEEPAKTTARPTWFEARIGQPYDAGTPIGDGPATIDTPNGPVPIHGLIDRVETVPGTEPTQAVVRDYKTGSSIPGEADALLGLNFQLPLYALMTEDALDDVETVGAAYYQVSPPTSVSSRSGQITSQEMATYYKSDDVDVPLLRYSYPHFETHAAFRRFVEETTAERLGELATGIAEGRFQPTVLDPSDAGCRYCDYAHVCDVRPEHRNETIEHIDDEDVSVYVPPMARGDAVEDVVEVE